MPRPAMTMAMSRPSRSSRSSNPGATASSSSPANVSSSSSGIVPELTHDSASPDFKRVRKPSQRMLEALQTQEDPPEKDLSSETSSGKSKRTGSPASAATASSSSSPKKLRKTEKLPPELEKLEEAVVSSWAKSGSPKKPVLTTEISNTPSEKEPEVITKRTTRAAKGSKIIAENDALYSDVAVHSVGADPKSPVQETEESASPNKKIPRLKISLKRKAGDASTPDDGPSKASTPALSPRILPEPAAAKGQVKKSTKKLLKGKRVPKAKKEKFVLDPDEDEVPADDEDDLDSSSLLDQEESSQADDAGDGSTGGDKRLTARQRAKLYGAEDHLMKLEDARPKTPPPDFQEKKEERNKKRREQAAQRREDLKKETVDKLLHKSSTSRKSAKGESPQMRKSIRYQIDKNGMTMLYPEGVEVMQPMLKISPPKPVFCGMKGCDRLKKYTCSKSGIPLCSLECYKKSMIGVCK